MRLRKTGKRHTRKQENSLCYLGGLPNIAFIQVAHSLVAEEKYTGLFLHSLLRWLAGSELHRFLRPSLTGSCGVQTEGLMHSGAVWEQHGWQGSWSDSTPN